MQANSELALLWSGLLEMVYVGCKDKRPCSYYLQRQMNDNLEFLLLTESDSKLITSTDTVLIMLIMIVSGDYYFLIVYIQLECCLTYYIYVMALIS